MSLDFSPLQLLLLALSLANATVYALKLRRPPSFARSAAKTAAAGALALLSGLTGGPLLLTFGLALSALGDLALSRRGERAFLGGLAAFLLAHLAFIPLFIGVAEAPAFPRIILGGGVAALGVVVLFRLWPKLDGLRAPVAAYAAALLVMTLVALASPVARWPLPVGALLFLASDAALAYERFIFTDRPRGWTAPFIWASYYTAIVLIASAFLCPRFAG